MHTHMTHMYRKNNEGWNEIKCVNAHSYKCCTLQKGKYDRGLIHFTKSRIWCVFNLYFKMAYFDVVPFPRCTYASLVDFGLLFVHYRYLFHLAFIKFIVDPCAAQLWVVHSSLKPLYSALAALLIITAIHL